MICIFHNTFKLFYLFFILKSCRGFPLPPQDGAMTSLIPWVTVPTKIVLMCFYNIYKCSPLHALQHPEHNILKVPGNLRVYLAFHYLIICFWLHERGWSSNCCELTVEFNTVVITSGCWLSYWPLWATRLSFFIHCIRPFFFLKETKWIPAGESKETWNDAPFRFCFHSDTMPRPTSFCPGFLPD